MNETVEFIFALLLLELLLIWLAVKLQKAICRRHGKLGWAVPVFCAVSLALCCALLLLSPADISHYVVLLTDQRQHVFSSQAEMEAFLSSLATTDVAGIGYPSALRWAQGAPALLCIVIGGACAVVAAWRSYRENCH